MKTFKDIINEVAEPLSPDEKRFKAKHVIKKIDHPIDDDTEENIFKGGTEKDKTVEASYEDGEDEEVYESKLSKNFMKKLDKYNKKAKESKESVEEEAKELAEGPFKGVGKLMMKAKMAKQKHDANRAQRKNIKKRNGEPLKRAGDVDAGIGASLGTDADQAEYEKNSSKYRRADKIQKRLKREEVENLDELSRKTLASYATKASKDVADQYKAGNKEKSISRAKGVAKAQMKSRALDKLAKEEVENLDELKSDYVKTQREKDRAHDSAMGRTKTGRKKPVRRMTSTQRSMASMREESQDTVDVKGKNIRKFIKKAKSMTPSKGAKEVVDGEYVESFMNEAVKAGNIKLGDGTRVKITNEDAQVMNDLFSELNSSNQKRMEEEMMKSKDGFDKVLNFAREASE